MRSAVSGPSIGAPPPAPVRRSAAVPTAFAFAVALLAGIVAPARAAVDLLPDIIIRANDLYVNDIVTNIVPGRVHLRLANGTPNIGDGKLYLYGVLPAYPDGTQDVMQRVFADDGSHYDRPAGRFVYHSEHEHIHLQSWCAYRLREVLPGDGVGDVVAGGAKTSFCVVDLAVYDNSLPGFDSNGEFHNCGSTIQGLSVGWVDVYSKGLAGQNIDITGLPDGVYWLESEADPDNHILEKNEANNVARIQVTIGAPGPINPDPFEPNDSLQVVDERPTGGFNSPNLGPCGPESVIGGLTIDQGGDEDYFRFYVNHRGGDADFVRINFNSTLGDLDLKVYNASGSEVGSSTGLTDIEFVSLKNRQQGWYYARVYGYAGATNPAYELTVHPPQNGAPAVSVQSPPAGNVVVQHGAENYTVTWNASDPEADLTWVTVYVNSAPALDGNEILLPTTLSTPGAQGFAVINSAELEAGEYWVYCRITDGGTVTGSWSQGTVTFFEPTTAAAGDHGPTESRLLAAFPNPFTHGTTLRFGLAQVGRVRWSIYDARGRLVRTLLDGELPAGRHTLTWDGADASGRRVASGVYYAVVRGPQLLERQKLVLLR